MLNLYNAKNHNSEPVQSSATRKKVDFTKYVDPTGDVSSKELSWGLWYVKHEVVLYKTLIGSLIGVAAILWIFNIWKWTDYLLGFQDGQKVEANLASFINYSGAQAAYGAQPVQILSTNLFASRENKTDIVSEISNPNSHFLVSFDYYFVINGQKTPSQKTFLLPNETRPVAYLGAEGDVSSPSVFLENFTWSRISNHEVANTQDWQNYRLNFSVSDFIFLKSLGQESPNADAIQFKLTNNSPYSYNAPDFYVALLQNGSMVGILPLHLDSIKTLETKNIDLRSLAPGLSVTEIAVYPIINIYDNSVYITY